MNDWQDIKTAPMDGTVIEILTEHGFNLEASREVIDDCGAWCAISIIHPECWEEGVCWDSSDQPKTWRQRR